LGLRYLAGNGIDISETEAARWMMQAAYQGDAPAEYWLATFYDKGRGVPADAFQAHHWYEAAAKKGNIKAMHNTAMAKSDGVDRNMTEAARWFEKAASYGYRASQFNIGVLYESGAGVNKDLVAAYKWFTLAAAQGDKDAAM